MKSMDVALKSMNLEKVYWYHTVVNADVWREGGTNRPTTMLLQVAGIMDQFERQFEHLDVQTQTMDEAMSGVTTLTVPEVRTTLV